MTKDTFYIYGSENPKQRSKAHIYSNDLSKSLCGVDGFWMEAGTSFTSDGDNVSTEDGISPMNFDEYIDCKKCNKVFKQKYLNISNDQD